MKCWRLTDNDLQAIGKAVEQIEKAYLSDKIETFLKKDSNFIFAVEDDNIVTGYAYGYP